MAFITKKNLSDYPASLFYNIPTGGAKPNEWYDRPNTYLSTLGTQRTEYPPVGWDDQPVQLGINPDMLNDPAFSEYDLSQLRTFEKDPRLRDEIDLGIVGTKSASKFATTPKQHARYAGFTYIPGWNYDPNKVYVDDLDKLKMAVGPGVEQTKQGNINKQIATTIAHEYRHNMFDQPEYSGIIDAAFDRFGGWGGNISRYDLEEYINRAADVQLDPENWKQSTLDEYQDEYNEMLTNPESWIENEEWYNRSVPKWKQRQLLARKMPAHLTPMNTTKQFNRAATDFFNKVRREKLKRPTQINIQKQKIGMPEHLTHGGADVMPTPRSAPISVPVPAHISGGGGDQRGSMPTGTAGRNPWGRAHGGLIDIPLSGRSRYI